MSQIEEVKEALKVIIENQNSKALNYCVNYAKAALFMDEEELKCQILYVLANMTHWRGEQAKQVRKVLKNFIK